MSAKMDDDFDRKTSSVVSVFAQKYTLPESLEVLNEIHTPIWVTCFHPQKTKILWANIAGIQLWGKKSIDEIVAIDIISNRSGIPPSAHATPCWC